MQRIVLVPTGAADSAIPRPRHALVLTAPDPAATTWASRSGLPAETRPELARTGAGADAEERVRRIEALVRARAVSDRWRDLVVVADAETVRALTAALCDLPGTSSLSGADDVVTVGLPRGAKPVRPAVVAVGTALVTLVTIVMIQRVYPLLVPALVAVAGLPFLPWLRVRHVGRTLLLVGALSALAVFVLVAGSTRFPAE